MEERRQHNGLNTFNYRLICRRRQWGEPRSQPPLFDFGIAIAVQIIRAVQEIAQQSFRLRESVRAAFP